MRSCDDAHAKHRLPGVLSHGYMLTVAVAHLVVLPSLRGDQAQVHFIEVEAQSLRMNLPQQDQVSTRR